MKQLCCLIVALCISVFAASAAAAQEYKSLGTQDGVEVMTSIDPLGPNNLIAAYIRFVNHNEHKVKITWTPGFTCVTGRKKEGYGAPFSMDAAASYEVSIWRLSACGPDHIKDLKVKMVVKRD